MRILVTGATGFLGSACLRGALLRERDAGGPLVIRGSSRTRVVAPLPGVDYVMVGEINATTDWKSALAGVDMVIHTAGMAHIIGAHAASDLASYRRVNTAGTIRLAEEALRAGVRRLVFVSSIGVNGSISAPGAAFSEIDVPRPHNAYARSKLEAEQGLERLTSQYGLEIVTVRPPLIYGPGAPGNFGALLRVVKKGWPLPLGSIHNRRSFVGLDNLVSFLFVCATDARAANHLFLISDGQDLSTTEFVRAMGRICGRGPPLLSVPSWLLNVLATAAGRAGALQSLCGDLRVNIDKARNVLGWSAPLTVEEGLRRAVLPSQLRDSTGQLNP